MEVVKRFLFYIIAGVIAVAAVAFYATVVRGIASKYAAGRKTLETTRDNLKGLAAAPQKIPNDKWIAEARKLSDLVSVQIDDAERFLARQPRKAETRKFFENEKFGPEKEISERVSWLNAYEMHNEELRRQLEEAGFRVFQVQTLSSLWGSGLPTKENIDAAMELYWYQKDLADFFTDQAEKDLAEYMQGTVEAGAFPAKPADLVISRNYARLDELLRGEDRQKLINTFRAMIFNEKQLDLAMIFNENLPGFKANSADPNPGAPWEEIMKITMDEEQRKYLDNLVPAGKEDLSNHQRFKDLVMELRLVRYRTDVIGLLDSRQGFDGVASRLRKGTEEERARLIQEINEWSSTKLAQAIGGVVCLRNEKDYNLVRNNHAPQVAELASFTISGIASGASAEAGREGPPAAHGGAPAAAATAATANSDVYKTFGFTMRVKLEYEHLPIFVRRMLNNAWRYNIKILRITPSEVSRSREIMGEVPMTGGPGPGFGRTTAGPGFGPGMSATTTTTLPAAGSGAGAEGNAPVEVKNYVDVEITGEAYQFTPVLKKVMEAAEAAAKKQQGAAQ